MKKFKGCKYLQENVHLGLCCLFFLLTIDTELDLSTSIAHRTGGSADVDACLIRSGVVDVEVSIGIKLKRGAVPG